jgi:hypothetical protein
MACGLILHLRAVEADAAGVGLGQARDDLANDATIEAEDIVQIEGSVERSRRDTLRRRSKIGRRRRRP